MGKVLNMDKFKDEEETNKWQEIMKQNGYYKYVARILGNVPLDCETSDDVGLITDYIKQNIKFDSLGEVKDKSIDFYYNLLQTGYRTFGANFFKMMCMNDTNTINLFVGVWSLINGLESLAQDNMDSINTIKAYESLELTEEQKEQFKNNLSKNSEENQ
jgi:hypothetical protein